MLDPDALNERLANFMMLFRSTQPELVNYFEDEELYPNEWAPSWLQFLLTREVLRLSCVCVCVCVLRGMHSLCAPHTRWGGGVRGTWPAPADLRAAPVGHVFHVGRFSGSPHVRVSG